MMVLGQYRAVLVGPLCYWVRTGRYWLPLWYAFRKYMIYIDETIKLFIIWRKKKRDDGGTDNRRTDRTSSCGIDPFWRRIWVKIRNLPFKNQSQAWTLNLHDLSFRGQYIDIYWVQSCSDDRESSGQIFTTDHILPLLIFYTWEQGTANHYSMGSLVKNDFQL